jgi:D-amino-acid dehydrogenase
MELHKQGLLVAAREPAAARRFLAGLEPMRDLGYDVPDEILEGARLAAAEPALGPGTRAGLRIGEHWHVLPASLIAGLGEALRRAGVEILEGAEVVDLERSGDAIARVRTAAGDVEADAVVLAAGAWTPRLARLAGLRLPVQAGKGYSLSVRPTVVPRHALLLAEPHVGCSPFGDRLRVAGTMEFSGIDARLDRGRIARIVEGARSMLAPLHPDPPQELWSGLRPIAPDGLPIVDRAPGLSNAYLATAYSMLGMTLAAPAGEALAELVLTGRRPEVLAPFAATRFRRVSRDGARGIRRSW